MKVIIDHFAEFATTGKPIIVSNWSGYKDFLPEENTVYLEGELKQVHKSSQNKFLLKEPKMVLCRLFVTFQRFLMFIKTIKHIYLRVKD